MEDPHAAHERGCVTPEEYERRAQERIRRLAQTKAGRSHLSSLDFRRHVLESSRSVEAARQAEESDGQATQELAEKKLRLVSQSQELQRLLDRDVSKYEAQRRRMRIAYASWPIAAAVASTALAIAAALFTWLLGAGLW